MERSWIKNRRLEQKNFVFLSSGRNKNCKIYNCSVIFSKIFTLDRYREEVIEIAKEADEEGRHIVQTEADDIEGVEHLGAPGGEGEEEEKAIVEPVSGHVPGLPQAVSPH